MNLTNFERSPQQTLQVHCYAGSMYSVLGRVGKGLNAATGIVKFAPATKVTALRNELTPQGLVQIFQQPFGSKVGRIVKLERYLGLSLSNIDVVEAFDFFFPDGPGGLPTILLVIHIDGAQETSFAHVFAAVGRLMNLVNLRNKIECLQIFGLDEAQESTLEMKALYDQALLPGIYVS